MSKATIWSVVAGVGVIIVVTTLVDIALHVTGVFPPMSQPINNALALLATSYRIVISVGGAWLTARLAPEKPLKHAMILVTRSGSKISDASRQLRPPSAGQQGVCRER